MTKELSDSARQSISRKSIERLEKPKDEAFLSVFGFHRKESLGADSPNHAFIRQFVAASRQEDYVDLCIQYGVALLAEHHELGRKRADERRVRERETAARWRSDEDAYWHQSNKTTGAPKFPPVPMHESEVSAISEIFGALTKKTQLSETTVVSAFPHSGIAYALQRLLPECVGFEKYFPGGIYHLHIGALDYPDTSKNKLSKKFLLKDGNSDQHYVNLEIEVKIASQLHACGALLIIHGASSIPDRASEFIQNLSRALEETSVNQITKGVSRLLLTSWELGAFSFLNNHNSRHLIYRPSIRPDDATIYFREALAHYRKARGFSLGERTQIGPRAENSILKRVDHHYRDESSGFTQHPSAIRFRAFCASDTTNPSPFDPTQGVWDRTSQRIRAAIPEITECLSDIQSDIRSYADRGTTHDLTALRVISTGLFFVSQRMLKQLLKKPHLASKMAGVSFLSQGLRSKYVNMMSNSRFEVKDGQRFTAPLLVRSLVQDDWMRFDPKTRSEVHEAIGDILLEMAINGDESFLAEELPYAAPWGDWRIVVALEAIRHFSRAANSTTSARAVAITRKALTAYNRFLEEDVFSSVKAKPNQVPPGKLSRAHGLHSLKYEALCLLSSDGRGHEAPRGTDALSQTAFFREIGITLIRMLRPKEASLALTRGASSEDVSNVDRCYMISHDITARIMLGDLSSASDQLERLRSLNGSEADPFLKELVKRRIEARQAMLSLMRGRRQEARSLWETVSEEGLAPFYGDRAIGYFDAFLSSPRMLRQNLHIVDELWAKIERASHTAHSFGFEHERLQIELRRASLMRVAGFSMASEAILDHVGLSLVKHSGAEVLFREFQIESAKTLQSLGRPKYALVAYAWPAYQSLRRKEAIPLRRKAKSTCLSILRSITLTNSEKFIEPEDSRFWQEIRKTNESNFYPLYSVDLLPSSEEVRFYFSRLGDGEILKEYRRILNL